DNDAVAETKGGVVAGISVAVQSPEARITGHTTTAFNGDVLDATDVSIVAESENTATSTSKILSITIAGGGAATAVAEITATAGTSVTVGSAGSLSIGGNLLVQARFAGVGNKAKALSKGDTA